MSPQFSAKQSVLGYGVLAIGSTIACMFFYSPRRVTPNSELENAGTVYPADSLKPATLSLLEPQLQDGVAVPTVEQRDSQLVPLQKIEEMLPLAVAPPNAMGQWNDAAPIDREYPNAQPRLQGPQPHIVDAASKSYALENRLPQGTASSRSSDLLVPLNIQATSIGSQIGNDSLKETAVVESRFGAGKYRPMQQAPVDTRMVAPRLLNENDATAMRPLQIPPRTSSPSLDAPSVESSQGSLASVTKPSPSLGFSPPPSFSSPGFEKGPLAPNATTELSRPIPVSTRIPLPTTAPITIRQPKR